jgi:hypothetical protein
MAHRVADVANASIAGPRHGDPGKSPAAEVLWGGAIDLRRRANELTTFAGTWDISIATPIGDIAAVFDITEADGAIRGIARSDEETVDFLDPVAVGNRLTWTQKVTTPMQLTLKFDVTVDGDMMTGTSNPGGMMPASKVKGTRSSPS